MNRRASFCLAEKGWGVGVSGPAGGVDGDARLVKRQSADVVHAQRGVGAHVDTHCMKRLKAVHHIVVLKFQELRPSGVNPGGQWVQPGFTLQHPHHVVARVDGGLHGGPYAPAWQAAVQEGRGVVPREVLGQLPPVQLAVGQGASH